MITLTSTQYNSAVKKLPLPKQHLEMKRGSLLKVAIGTRITPRSMPDIKELEFEVQHFILTIGLAGYISLRWVLNTKVHITDFKPL